MHLAHLALAASLAASFSTALSAQVVAVPFNNAWSAVSLGQTGVGTYFGTAFAPGNPNVLLISPYQPSQIAALPLVRDPAGHIVGFGPLSTVATVGGTDGGLAVGPNNVLFFTWYGPNRLGQILPGSNVANRVDDLGPLGVVGSVGACTFVPAGLPGAGRLKLATWGGSTVYDATLTPDGTGTFAPTIGTSTLVSGGPEGMVYAPANAPLIGGQLLIAEWNTGSVVAYQVDANGDPLPATRQVVIGGLYAPGGGAVDPQTGDLVFSQSNGQLVVMTASAACGTATGYGTATPGASGTPQLAITGCPRIGQTVTLQATHAPNALGVLAFGEQQIAATWNGLLVLNTLNVTVVHVLDASGGWTLPLALPPVPAVGNRSYYFQVAYLDGSTPSGFVASAGIDLFVR